MRLLGHNINVLTHVIAPIKNTSYTHLYTIKKNYIYVLLVRGKWQGKYPCKLPIKNL